MEKPSQENILKFTFYKSIDLEELLLKKYDIYSSMVKDPETKEYLKEFEETSREHIDLLKDKMLKLNIQMR